jgi:hypothetical protein
LQALARKANAEGRLVTIFDVGEFKYIDDVEALALLGPLALTSLAGIHPEEASAAAASHQHRRCARPLRRSCWLR